MDHLYTPGSLGNMVSWGDQQILEHVDEIANMQAIAYDRKRKFMMKRTVKKRKLTFDSTLLITMEEALFDTEHAKMIELIGAQMDIMDATLDKAKKDKEEASAMRKELDHLHHRAEYYQNSTQAVVLLKSEF